MSESERQVEWTRERKLEVMNAVLRVAARHVSFLRKEAFEEIAAELARHVPFACLAIAVPEGQDKRLYAVSMGASPARMPPFGARFHFDEGVAEGKVMREGVARVCDDTRTGDPLDRPALAWGFLSYVVLPIRVHESAGSAAPRAVAKLTVAFHETGKASDVPLDVMQEVADLFGEGFSRSLSLARDRRLAMILETSGDAMLAWDHQHQITDANLAATLLTGRRHEELLGMSIRDLLSSLENDIDAAPLHGARMGLRRRATELEPEPEEVPVSVTITRVEDDPFVAAHALIRDESHVVATEREASAHLLRVRALEQELRTLLDNAPLIIFRIDPETRTLKYLNRHAERLLGVPTSEALTTPGFLRAAHRDPEAAATFDSAIANAKVGLISPPYEARLRGTKDSEITVRGTIYPLIAEDGAVVAIEGILADVSAEHLARTRLVQADRLSTLGMIAASVAHEINNPAAFILLRLDALERMLASVPPSTYPEQEPSPPEVVHELRDSIQRIVHIARDLRLFASPPAKEGTVQVLDVNESVRSALTLTRAQLIERARVVENLGTVSPVLMESGRLGQVLVNLLMNAIQALPKSSKLRHQVTVTTRDSGPFVEIEIADTGVGIRSEELTRIWTPFFTTKTRDVGTGLGLSISREIIQRAGGNIRVESPVVETEDGARGSRFIVALPIAEGAVPGLAVRTVRRYRGRFDRMNVLIVEDDVELARALADELGREHEVEVANGADEALDLMEARSFDAVLCDLRMPRVSGEALYERVCAVDGDRARRFVFMTGVGFGSDVERFLSKAGRPFLEKPFSTDDVLAAIRRVAHDHRA